VAVEEYAARVDSLNTKAMSLRVPYLDTAATIDPGTRTLTCAIVNRAENQAIDAEVTVTGGGINGEVEVWTLTGESLEAENTVDDPQRVTPVHRVVDSRELGHFSFSARSMTIVRGRMR